MISAFGVDHGGISKAMSPNKLKGLTRQAMKNTSGLTGDRTGKSGYATQRLKAYTARDDLNVARGAKGQARLIAHVNGTVRRKYRKLP